MKKKMIQRGLLGFPLGIAIGFVITVIISMCIGDGSFYPVNPELIDTMKNELNAVILQTILCGILGTGFAMASVIWEIDSWSLAKQSGIYFSIACVTMFPIALFGYLIRHKNKCSTETYSSPIAFASSSAWTSTLFRSCPT